MLAALAIRDIVIIDRLELTFSGGMTVMTGETGAGKSILLDALALALGARGDAGLVRAGATEGEVTAVFEVAGDHPVRTVLTAGGITVDGELILRRVQSSDGRSRAFINDRPVSVGLMTQVGAGLTEIHGQHDDRALVSPGVHRGLTDAFGGLDGARADVGAAYAAWRQATAAVEHLAATIEAARADADHLSAAVAELEALAPKADEEAALADARRQMMRAEAVAGDIAEAQETVGGSESPVRLVAGVARRLERKATAAGGAEAGISRAVVALDRALEALGEAEQGLGDAAAAAVFDPDVLERAEARLFALRAAARKHAVSVAELPAVAARLAGELAALDTGEQELAALKQQAAATKASYDARATDLSKRRRAAARRLEKAVAAELPALKLERAGFMVAVESDPARATETGIDRIAFQVTTNPGGAPGPLMKVASGGELARFLLALKVSLADRGSAPTLIFDEIDTAVSGAVADAIGVRLARLAERVQVLSVTHAPQVAARADAHLLVTKQAAGRAATTRAEPLDDRGRREEIARMLAGATVTKEARAAAERLILGAA